MLTQRSSNVLHDLITEYIATAVPVCVFAILIAMGANKVAKAYDLITIFEKWARKITGILFILTGIYYSLVYILGVSM